MSWAARASWRMGRTRVRCAYTMMATQTSTSAASSNAIQPRWRAPSSLRRARAALIAFSSYARTEATE